MNETPEPVSATRSRFSAIVYDTTDLLLRYPGLHLLPSEQEWSLRHEQDVRVLSEGNCIRCFFFRLEPNPDGSSARCPCCKFSFRLRPADDGDDWLGERDGELVIDIWVPAGRYPLEKKVES